MSYHLIKVKITRMAKNKQEDYAVIRIKGSQYIVSKGDEILVDRLGEEKPKAEVLLLNKNGKVEIGKPILEKAKVEIKDLGEEKGEKLKILKFKAKSRYRRRYGFRPKYSRLLISNI